MPWTGPNFIRHNEDYSGASVWQDDAAASILIESVRHDFHDQDLAQGIDACINKNGANSPTADINWGGFKITNQGYGVNNNDSAAYGQVPISASLNGATNVLTLTNKDGSTFTVDLSALAVGGSTADFARYSNTLNPFQGSAYFAGSDGVGCHNAFTILDPLTVSGATFTWSLSANTATSSDWSNTAGAVCNFSGNSGAATLRVNGSPVWTNATLTPTQVANFLNTTGNYTITGSWNFTGGSIQLPLATTFGGTGAAWQTNVSTTAFQLFSVSSSALVKFDYDVTEGTRAFVDGNRLWSNNNWRVIASATPTGGVNDDVALVLTGANQGLWCKVSGTWTKIIAGP